DEGYRRIHIQRAVDPQRVRTNVVNTQDPILLELMFHAETPLLGIGVEKLVRIADQCGCGEELIEVAGFTRTNVKAAQRGNRSCRECRQGHGGDARRESYLPGSGGVIKDSGGTDKRVVRLGIVDDLRIVDAEASADNGLAIAAPVVSEAGARSEVFAGVRKRLLFVAQPQIQR